MTSSNNLLYFRSPGAKMAVFIALSGICLIFGGLLSFSVVAAILKVGISELPQIILEPQYASLAQFANATASIIAFGVPSLVIALLSQDKWSVALGLNPFFQWRQVFLVIVIAITGLFLSGALGDLTEKMPFPTSIKNWATQLEEQYKKALFAMTQMKSIGDLLLAIIAVAVIPAIVEELYFRATLQKMLMDWVGKPYLAIVITAILFSAFHFSFFGFLSRMSLGIIIGIVYYYTKTIWLPILMHFINNAIGIITLYWIRDQPEKIESVMDGNFTYYWGFVAIIVIIFLCKKLKNSYPPFPLEKSINL